MSSSISALAIQIIQIIWIDVLLSGDNAVVIALACRSLPGRKKNIGLVLGASAAVIMRLLLTVIVLNLMTIPWLKIVSAVLLIYIAVKLLLDDGESHSMDEAASLWHAIKLIVIADVIMSLDNVIAVAAAARGSFPLILFGLILSIPLIIFTSQLFIALIERFRALIWAGAALMGWIAGELCLTDPILSDVSFLQNDMSNYTASTLGAFSVLIIAGLLRQRNINTNPLSDDQSG
jgi:YjbE family integral membrane protein